MDIDGSSQRAPDPKAQSGVSPPDVSVIVPHYRDFHRLDLCLTALGRQTYPSERIEIVVADNASPEGEEVLVQAIAGRARLVIVTERGAGAARNGGVAVARGPVLAFTDSDCVPEPEWLAEGVAALSSCDFAGGRMKVLVDDPARMAPAEAFETVFAFNNERYVKQKGFTVTANLFCTLAVFNQVGGFLAAGVSEDAEWSYRARDKGYRIGYASESIVGHPARKTWGELMVKWRRINSETYGLIGMKRLGKLYWFIRSFAVPLSAIIHSPRVLFNRKLTSLDERLGALGILYRLRIWRLFDSMRLLLTDPER